MIHSVNKVASKWPHCKGFRKTNLYHLRSKDIKTPHFGLYQEISHAFIRYLGVTVITTPLLAHHCASATITAFSHYAMVSSDHNFTRSNNY